MIRPSLRPSILIVLAAAAAHAQTECSRNCGQPERGGGTCRLSNGRCTACNEDRVLQSGRCYASIACKGRRIQSGSQAGTSCRCTDDHCHYCNRAAAGDVCRVCRDGFYLLDGACVEACPTGTASLGVGNFKRRCMGAFSCAAGRIVPKAIIRNVGNCDVQGYSPIDSLEGCDEASRSIGLVDTAAHDISEGRSSAQLANQASLPFGCYYMADHPEDTQLLFNPNGHRNSTDASRPSVCVPDAIAYGCKCATDEMAAAACQNCEFRADEFGQHCTKCNGGKYLFNNRCHDSCNGTGLISYAPGNYGRECRAPFTCADRSDEDGNDCKCNRAVGKNDCAVCDYGTNGPVCSRCTNSKYLSRGTCVNACQSDQNSVGGGGASGRECQCSAELLPGRSLHIRNSQDPAVLTTSTLLCRTDYPSITNMPGSVVIDSNPGLASMDGGFLALREIGGFLEIWNNNAMTSLGDGLSGLQEVGTNLRISDNEALTSLGDGFSALQEIGGNSIGMRGGAGLDLVIRGNPALASLGTAFRSLERIVGRLIISDNNPQLTDFENFRNLTCHGGTAYASGDGCPNCPSWLIDKPRCATTPGTPGTTAIPLPTGANNEWNDQDDDQDDCYDCGDDDDEWFVDDDGDS